MPVASVAALVVRPVEEVRLSSESALVSLALAVLELPLSPPVVAPPVLVVEPVPLGVAVVMVASVVAVLVADAEHTDWETSGQLSCASTEMTWYHGFGSVLVLGSSSYGFAGGHGATFSNGSSSWASTVGNAASTIAATSAAAEATTTTTGTVGEGRIPRDGTRRRFPLAPSRLGTCSPLIVRCVPYNVQGTSYRRFCPCEHLTSSITCMLANVSSRNRSL